MTTPLIQTLASRDVTAPLVIGVVALASRLVVIATAPDYPLVTDMQEYWERAIHIFQNGVLAPSSWRMPGYPLALAGAFAIGGGPSLLSARLLNAVAGVVAALLTYWLSRRTAGPKPSFIAGMAVALYPAFLLYSTLVITESLVLVPILGALVATTYSSWRAVVAAGVCAALAALVRPAGIAVLPAVLVACAMPLRMSEPRRVLRPVVAALVFAVTMAPWWIHNARLHSRFVPLDTTGSYNLLIGNAPYATGRWDWSVVARMESELLQGVDWQTPAGADRAAQLATTEMREQPQRVLRLFPAKLAALLALEGREHGYLYTWGYYGQRTSATVWLWSLAIVVSFPLLLTAALAGLACRHGVTPHVLVPSLVFLASMVAMHLISFGDPRFHTPAVPVLAVLATGVAQYASGVVRWRWWLGAAILLCLAWPWSMQLSTYLRAVAIAAAPGGWNSHLLLDDLLWGAFRP